MQRRAFNQALLAAAFAGFGANILGARAQPSQAGTDESLDLMLEEMVAETGGMPPITTFGPDEIKKDEALRKEIVKRVGGKLPDLSVALKSTAPAWTQSIDAAHLGTDQAAEGEFVLDPALLENLARANGFSESFTFPFRLGAPQSDRVLFGLRGCEIVDATDAGAFKPSVRVKVAAPDHVGMRCTMGIWDRTTGQVAVFRASTVPHLAFVEVYRIYLVLRGRLAPAEVVSIAESDKLLDASTGSNWYSNCLSQGLHIYYIGPHGDKQPNMLRQSDDWFAQIARAKSILGFTNDDWESPGAAVCDNIHAAYDLNPRAVISFQSNGCNVISGSVAAGKYSGDIAKFRTLLTLDELGRKSKTIVGANANQKFFYMLLTGREAFLQSQRPGDPALNRVRFGTSGARATTLRKQLEDLGHKTLIGRDPKDIVGRGTVEALRKEQQGVGQPKDGVLSSARAAELEFTWA